MSRSSPRKNEEPEKPAVWKVEHNDYWPGQMIHIGQAELEDGDHLRIDEQGYDKQHEGDYI